jgi:hypothetical protein
VIAHADLLATTLEALAVVTDQQPDQRWNDADAGERLAVRPFLVTAACAASLALDGPQPFVEVPAVAGPAASAAVLDRLLLGDPDPRRATRPTTPAEGYRAVLTSGLLEGWPWDWLNEEGPPAKAAVAAEVHRRVSAVARLLPDWPPPNATRTGRLPTWTHPTRPLRLHGGVDLVLGRRDGTHTLVVVIGGDHRSTTRRRLTYEALVETLALRRAPAAVHALLPDAGRSWRVDVDAALLREGIDAAVLGARTAFGTATATDPSLPRTPGPLCRRCAHQATCTEGTAWLSGPGRLRAGFLPPA